jgi:hypothetical protein
LEVDLNMGIRRAERKTTLSAPAPAIPGLTGNEPCKKRRACLLIDGNSTPHIFLAVLKRPPSNRAGAAR